MRKLEAEEESDLKREQDDVRLTMREGWVRRGQLMRQLITFRQPLSMGDL